MVLNWSEWLGGAILFPTADEVMVGDAADVVAGVPSFCNKLTNNGLDNDMLLLPRAESGETTLFG